VEEKERAKDAPSIFTAIENGASANIVVGKKTYYNNNKGKMQDSGKTKKTTNFKKKKTGKGNKECFVYDKEGRLDKDYCHRKTNSNGQQKKVVNVTISKNNGNEVNPSRCGNLPIFFSAIQSSD
jgi:hypothetical protein